MKKHLLVLILFLGFLSFESHSQFLHAYGATIGVTRAKQIWTIKPFNYHETHYRTGFNGSLFLEFFNHDVFTWVMEAQFNQKGTRFTDADNVLLSKSRANYACFNNFLKARTEGIDINLYILGGPRIEYLISGNGPLPYNQLHFSVSGGLGCDFNYLEPIILFTELHYNPDITHSVAESMKHRAFELKIGIKKKINTARFNDPCPPVFL